MLPLDFVFVTLVGLTMLFGSVQSKPAPYYSVNLKRCDATASNISTIEQCGSVCQSIRVAQDSCFGVPACTCSTAPAETIKTCLECHIREQPNSLNEESILTITSKVTAYSLICDSLLNIRTPTEDLKLEVPSPPANITAREVEGRPCLFGLPDIVFPEPSAFTAANSRSPWMYLAFAVVVILCVAEVRWRSSRS